MLLNRQNKFHYKREILLSNSETYSYSDEVECGLGCQYVLVIFFLIVASPIAFFIFWASKRERRFRKDQGLQKNKNKTTGKQLKNNLKECKPIKDLYLKSDDEISEIFNELSRPLYSAVKEVRKKTEDWLPDDEREAYESFISDMDEFHYYFPFPKDVLEFLRENSDELTLDDLFDHITMDIMLNRETEPLTGFEIVDQAQRSIRNLHIKYFQIIWSFFDINEDLFKVISLFEKDNLSKKEKIEWESYQKSLFYNDKKQIKRIIDLCFLIYEKDDDSDSLNEDIESIEEIDNEYKFGFVYLIRNQDIYKIGITQNLLQRMQQLKPDEIIDSVRCSNYVVLEKEIHKEFKACRIPQTEYFRLDQKQIKQIHKIFTEKAKK